MAQWRSTLPDEVRRFIVTRNAMFDRPGDVVAQVMEEFGIKISRQHVEKHDPTKVNGKGLAKALVILFEETRSAFLAECAGIPAAQKAVRIKDLERWSQKAADMGAVTHAADIQEKIAKELANAYQHHFSLRHTGHGGGAIEHEVNAQSNVRVFMPWNQRDGRPQAASLDEEELDGDGK